MTSTDLEHIRRLLRDQLAIAWALLEHHLQNVTDEDLMWPPAPLNWTMHRNSNGWEPDWADTEPLPTPVPTVAWLTWHLGWWWTTATAHLNRSVIPQRKEISWPGTATGTVEWLTRIHADYHTTLLQQQDLGANSAFPWAGEADRTLADMAAWVNIELMKNAAEIGQLLILRRAKEHHA